MVRLSDENRQKAIFEQYTVFDIDIAKITSNYRLYLIGGTAIDLLCNYHSVPFWRSRSNNDFDFWASFDNQQNTNEFIEYIRDSFRFDIIEDSDYMITLESSYVKADVDILIDCDYNNKQFTHSAGGINVMSPIYLFSSKFDRYINCNNSQRKEIDFKDLRTLLSIIEKINRLDDLEYHLSSLNYDQKAENMLNSIIASL